MYEWQEFTAIGGLVSYSAVRGDALLQTGIYVGRILNGAKAAPEIFAPHLKKSFATQSAE